LDDGIPVNSRLHDLARRALSKDRVIFHDVFGAFTEQQCVLNAYRRLRKSTKIASDFGMHSPLRFDLHDTCRRAALGLYKLSHKQPPPPKRRLRWAELRRLDPTPRLPDADDTLLEAVGFGLQALFNSLWHNSQHGYRSDRSCHTAIQTFRQARGATHLLTINLKRNFEEMNTDVLFEQLRQRTGDIKLEKFVADAFRTGHIEFKDEAETLNDVPRANSLAAVLANIYFNKLDLHVGDLRAKFRKLSGSSVVESDTSEHRRMTRDLWYIRYANMVLFSTRGTRSDVYWLQENLDNFFRVELKMPLDVSEMVLEEAETGLTYLGAHLFVENKEGALITRHNAPISYIIRRLAAFGICNLDGEPLPKNKWQHHDKEFILALHNAVLNRIVKYYSFADNYSQLVHRIQYIIRHACAKLLVKKYGMRSRGGAFQTLGKDLGAGQEFGLSLRENLRQENIRDRELWQGREFFNNHTRWWT